MQLTDVIAGQIDTDDPLHGYRFEGTRYDYGSRLGFLQATVTFGLARDDLRDDLDGHLRGLSSPV